MSNSSWKGKEKTRHFSCNSVWEMYTDVEIPNFGMMIWWRWKLVNNELEKKLFWVIDQYRRVCAVVSLKRNADFVQQPNDRRYSAQQSIKCRIFCLLSFVLVRIFLVLKQFPAVRMDILDFRCGRATIQQGRKPHYGQHTMGKGVHWFSKLFF